jgi:hypothetical protein
VNFINSKTAENFEAMNFENQILPKNQSDELIKFKTGYSSTPLLFILSTHQYQQQ